MNFISKSKYKKGEQTTHENIVRTADDHNSQIVRNQKQSIITKKNTTSPPEAPLFILINKTGSILYTL